MKIYKTKILYVAFLALFITYINSEISFASSLTDDKNKLSPTKKILVIKSKLSELQKEHRKISALLNEIDKNTISNSTKNSYIQDLQNAMDIAFVTIERSDYLYNLDTPVIFSNPENIIANIRTKILLEHLGSSVLDKVEEKHPVENIKLNTKKNNLINKLNSLDTKIARLEDKIKKLPIVEKNLDKNKSNQKIEIKKITETASISPIFHVINALPAKKPLIDNLYNEKNNPNNQNRVILPLNGHVVMDFGDITPLGVKSRGIMLELNENTNNKEIVTPLAGVVKFAGKFGKFKHLLIVEHKGGYHSLISGFDSIDVKTGDKLSAGDIVGKLAETQVYYELRYKGKPINPRLKLKSL